MNTQRKAVSWLVMSLATTSLAATQQSTNPDEHISIPLIINILEGAGCPPAEALGAVKAANKILKQANMRVQPTKLFNDVNYEGKTPEDNACVDDDEYDHNQREGIKEINEHNDGDGMKIFIADKPDEAEPEVMGFAVHYDPVMFVQCLPAEDGKSGKQRMGETIAHECAHALTIEGHSDDSDNLMYASEEGQTGTSLTGDQVSEMRAGAGSMGATTAGDAKGAENPRESGGAANCPGPAPQTGASYEIIRRTSIDALGSAAAYQATIVLEGFLPTGTLSLDFQWLFDSDANAATGATIAGVPGVDRIVVGHVSSATQATFFLEDPLTGFRTVLSGCVKREKRFLRFPTFALETDGADMLHVSIPKVLLQLGTGVSQVPVTVFAGPATAPTSQLGFALDREFHLRGPSVTLSHSSIQAGDFVTVAGSGFAPAEQILVWIDDDVAASSFANAFGTISVAIQVPGMAVQAIDGHYYLTAQSVATGLYGFGVVKIAP